MPPRRRFSNCCSLVSSIIHFLCGKNYTCHSQTAPFILFFCWCWRMKCNKKLRRLKQFFENFVILFLLWIFDVLLHFLDEALFTVLFGFKPNLLLSYFGYLKLKNKIEILWKGENVLIFQKWNFLFKRSLNIHWIPNFNQLWFVVEIFLSTSKAFRISFILNIYNHYLFLNSSISFSFKQAKIEIQIYIFSIYSFPLCVWCWQLSSNSWHYAFYSCTAYSVKWHYPDQEVWMNWQDTLLSQVIGKKDFF